jgi:hypothetical protein
VLEGKNMAESKSTEPILRALSVRQPYAEQILLGKKKFEYRSTNSNIRERVYLYASKGKVDDPAEWRKAGAKPDSLPTGVIVGSVEIVDSTFDEDEYIYAWKLARPERLAKPLVPINQPQPAVWRPQFAKPIEAVAAAKRPERTRSSPLLPPEPGVGKAAAGAITGELVCYHNPNTMRREVWEISDIGPPSAICARRYKGAEGSRIWLVTGRESPRRYFLAGWFTVDRVESVVYRDGSEDFRYHSGESHVATRIYHLVEIGREPWFKDLRRACANFATMQHVRDAGLLRYLEKAWSRTRALK